MKKFPMHRAQASRHQAAFTKAGPWHSSAILCRTCKKAELGIVKRSKANELLLVLPLLIHRIDHKQMSLEFPPHKRGSRGLRRANDISQARFSGSSFCTGSMVLPEFDGFRINGSDDNLEEFKSGSWREREMIQRTALAKYR